MLGRRCSTKKGSNVMIEATLITRPDPTANKFANRCIMLLPRHKNNENDIVYFFHIKNFMAIRSHLSNSYLCLSSNWI